MGKKKYSYINKRTIPKTHTLKKERVVIEYRKSKIEIEYDVGNEPEPDEEP